MTKSDRDAKRPATLAEQRAAAPETTPHRSRKNRRRWCKGKVGVEHTPGIRISRRGDYMLSLGTGACSWHERSHWVYQLVGPRKISGTWEGTGRWFWRCYHEDYCTTCGKVLGVNLNGVGKQRCPSYSGP